MAARKQVNSRSLTTIRQTVPRELTRLAHGVSAADLNERIVDIVADELTLAAQTGLCRR
jgi:hypothetical protein